MSRSTNTDSKRVSQKPEIPNEVLDKWQALVDVSARICGVPAALIMKVNNQELEVVVSADVDGNPYNKGERHQLDAGLYCETVIRSKKSLFVSNASLDRTWENNPDLAFGMIHYLGYPLLWPDEEIFGTICILDRKEKSLSDAIDRLIRLLKQTVEQYLALQFEIQERERVQKSLRKSEELYRILAENSNDVISIVDVENNRMRYVSPSCFNQLGYKPDELIGRELGVLMSPAAKQYYDSAHPVLLERFLSGEREAYMEELELIHKDGRIISTEVNGRYVLNDQSGRVESVAVSRDITERKTAEAERQALQAQLIQSKKLASLGTLVGGIAHDFNNMLQIISGYAEILIDGFNKDEKEYSSLNNIIKTSMEGAEVIRKLLGFGQQSQFIPKPVDLNETLRGFCGLVSYSLPGEVHIELELSPEPMIVKADVNQINQMIMILLENSSEAMPDGGTIRISTGKHPVDGDYCKVYPWVCAGDHVVLKVSDSGIGMDEETLSSIFDPFFSTKPRGSAKGMGLSLSMVRGVVQQYGGFISCSSTPGKGTEISLYFPSMDLAKGQTVKSHGQMQTVGTETILVVEDSALVADLEKAILEASGYKVLVASNGLEAVNIYRERFGEISVVLLDLQMPVMSGRQCLMELMKINPAVKALVYSGYSPEDDLSRQIAPYVCGFVIKPSSKADLLRAVRRAIDGTETT